jgi:hypothetical protein
MENGMTDSFKGDAEVLPDPDPARAARGYVQFVFPRDQNARLADAARHVLRVFSKDLEQGYRTKDKEFAVDILSAAIRGEHHE